MTRDPQARIQLAARARELYESGLTLVQVAERLSISYGKTHSLVKESGATLRKRGGTHGA